MIKTSIKIIVKILYENSGKILSAIFAILSCYDYISKDKIEAIFDMTLAIWLAVFNIGIK